MSYHTRGLNTIGALPEFYEIEEAIVYHIILELDDPKIDDFIVDKDNIPPDELTLLKSTFIGAVICRPLVSYATTSEEKLPLAFPTESNIKDYPLRNEIILVTKYLGKFFYQKLNNKNSVNSNESISLRKSFKPNPTGRGTAGRSPQQDDSEKLGKYFESNTKIHALAPYEGDILIEGRFGNSIRFGGYNDGPTTNQFNDNFPLLYIRNGENLDSQEKLTQGRLTEENINTDGSSIHMTSGDIITPWKRNDDIQIRAFENYNDIDFKGNQTIVSSDRIILSAKNTGQLIGHAKKWIGFITDGGYSIDTNDDIIFETQQKNFKVTAGRNLILQHGENSKIFLGKEDDESERLVKGDSLVKWLTDLINELKVETHPTAVGPSSAPTNAGKYSALAKRLESEILSQRNFTN